MSATPDMRMLEDRLASLQRSVDSVSAKLDESRGVVQLEPWVTKGELAEKLGCSKRWIDKQVALPPARAMPSEQIAGRRKFKLSEVERWIEGEESR
jgi:hypothetical protein